MGEETNGKANRSKWETNMDCIKITGDMKKHQRYAACLMHDNELVFVETYCGSSLYNDIQEEELLMFDQAKWHVETLREDGCHNIYLGYFDDNGTLRLCTM